MSWIINHTLYRFLFIIYNIESGFKRCGVILVRGDIKKGGSVDRILHCFNFIFSVYPFYVRHLQDRIYFYEFV